MLNANPAHLLKYSAAYAKLWPASTHIMVQQGFGLLFRSLATRANEIAPIIQVFQEAGVDFADSSRSRCIISHALSNGGASRLVRIEALLHRVAKGLQPKQRAPIALIFDSGAATLIFLELLGAITAGWSLPFKMAYALVLCSATSSCASRTTGCCGVRISSKACASGWRASRCSRRGPRPPRRARTSTPQRTASFPTKALRRISRMSSGSASTSTSSALPRARTSRMRSATPSATGAPCARRGSVRVLRISWKNGTLPVCNETIRSSSRCGWAAPRTVTC